MTSEGETAKLTRMRRQKWLRTQTAQGHGEWYENELGKQIRDAR